MNNLNEFDYQFKLMVESASAKVRYYWKYLAIRIPVLIVVFIGSLLYFAAASWYLYSGLYRNEGEFFRFIGIGGVSLWFLVWSGGQGLRLIFKKKR
ncbi:hypothetical protein LCGC14_2029610 [marine sediment metagenome]|uniref:Uncharacterized protein n=1 Tax=marine sediment metagenome TaxID=412755 RepID=A0A0F9HS54_9ZZZZ